MLLNKRPGFYKAMETYSDLLTLIFRAQFITNKPVFRRRRGNRNRIRSDRSLDRGCCDRCDAAGWNQPHLDFQQRRLAALACTVKRVVNHNPIGFAPSPLEADWALTIGRSFTAPSVRF